MQGLTKKLRELASLVFPIIGISWRNLALGDALPVWKFGQFGVECRHMLLVSGNIFLCKNGIDRTLWDANSAIYALIRVDGQKVRALAKAIHGADVHAIGVLAADTGFGDNVGHLAVLGLGQSPLFYWVLDPLGPIVDAPEVSVESWPWFCRDKDDGF